jgi:hypothetical protein
MNWPKEQVAVKSDWAFIKCTDHGKVLISIPGLFFIRDITRGKHIRLKP